MSADEKLIENLILFKLARKGKWQAVHISVDIIIKWIGLKIKKNGKRAKAALDRLVKEGLVLPKPAHYGLQISLNIRRKEEILRRIEKI